MPLPTDVEPPIVQEPAPETTEAVLPDSTTDDDEPSPKRARLTPGPEEEPGETPHETTSTAVMPCCI